MVARSDERRVSRSDVALSRSPLSPYAAIRAVTETPFFFERGPERLFGMLHAPSAEREGVPAFVMSHPFGEEKLWSHRVYVSFARALAARGHAVLRFDYTGAGDSTGITASTSLESHLTDLAAAVATLRARVHSAQYIGLIGLRLGATLAALFAENPPPSAASVIRDGPLVLWDPVLDGESYFQELLRSNLATQLAVYGKVLENREVLQERIRRGGAVNVDGYEIGKALFDSCGRRDLLPPGPKQHCGRTLVTQIVATDKQSIRDDLQSLASSYSNGGFGRAIEHPFWREIKPFYSRANSLQEATLAWLEQRNV